MPVKMNGATSGYTQLQAAAVAASNTLTLPDGNATLVDTSSTQTLTNKTINGGALQSSTAQASTSGTSITFSSIPSWVKRITVMFNGVSTSGTSRYLVQIGSSSVTSTGYISISGYAGSTNLSGAENFTAGFGVGSGAAANTLYGSTVLTLFTGNTWVSSSIFGVASSGTYYIFSGGGVSPALSGALDRVVVTTVNGTDTFDAGSINILYE